MIGCSRFRIIGARPEPRSRVCSCSSISPPHQSKVTKRCDACAETRSRGLDGAPVLDMPELIADHRALDSGDDVNSDCLTNITRAA